MTVDISKIKPGDKVTLVPLEVVNVCSPMTDVLNPVQVEVRDRHYQVRLFWVGPDQIAEHHPAARALEMGQEVLRMEDEFGAAVTGPWVVIGIHKEKVWLGSPEGENERYAHADKRWLKHMDGTPVESRE